MMESIYFTHLAGEWKVVGRGVSKYFGLKK